jgi:hypothetical protein
MQADSTRDYEMFTDDGNQAVGALIDQLVALAETTSPKDVIAGARDGLRAISVNHSEVRDTEPRGHIAHAIETAFAKQGATLSGVTWEL